MEGPLAGVTVVEMAGIGPGPHCCMMLADMGASVIRCEPPGGRQGYKGQEFQVPNRSRKSIIVDVKKPEGREVVLKLCETADVLVEGFRPGVMEKLGLGPDECMARNPRLVYGRMTGWGQTGPMAKSAGHDINYIALAGALHAIGGSGSKPVPPLNLVGDYGGGSMLLAFGIVCGLLQAKTSSKGNVIDAAMVDGTASLLAPTYGMVAQGVWDDARRSANLLDGGAHFYDTYECKDGGHVALGPIEPQFYAKLLQLTGTEGDSALSPQAQMKRSDWPVAKTRMEALFRTKTRDEWCALLEYSDACFAPVLTMTEATRHPHAVARGSYIELGGVVQPAPAPRFSHTPAAAPTPPREVGEDTVPVLRAAGLDVARLLACGAVVDRSAEARSRQPARVQSKL